MTTTVFLFSQFNFSVKDIFHERAWLMSSVFSVQIKVVVEVRDQQHGLQVKEALELQYPDSLLWGLDSGLKDFTCKKTGI